MFCPEGWITLYQIDRLFAKLGRETFPDVPIQGEEFEYWGADVRATAYSLIMFNRFVEGEGESFYAFIPPRDILSISSSFIMSSSLYDGEAPQDEVGANAAIEHLQSSRPFLDYLFRISASNPYDQEDRLSPPLTGGAARARGTRLAVEDEFWKWIKPLDGASACWKTPENTNVNEYLLKYKDENFHRFLHDKDGDTLSEKAGSFNMEVISKAFPYGIFGTWDEIEKRTGLSRRTINRTLNQHGLDKSLKKRDAQPAQLLPKLD